MVALPHLGRGKSRAGHCLAPSNAVPSLGIQPGISPPLPKHLGDCLINHGVFMETSSERLGGGGAAPKQRSAIPAEFQVFGAHPVSFLFLTPVLPLLALFPSPPGSTQRCWGPSGTSLLPLGPAGLPLPGGISSSCRRSRSIPLIAVNYLGVNGDVSRTSSASEAAGRNVLAELSREREMGEWVGAEQGEGKAPVGLAWAGKPSQPSGGNVGNGWEWGLGPQTLTRGQLRGVWHSRECCSPKSQLSHGSSKPG